MRWRASSPMPDTRRGGGRFSRSFRFLPDDGQCQRLWASRPWTESIRGKAAILNHRGPLVNSRCKWRPRLCAGTAHGSFVTRGNESITAKWTSTTIRSKNGTKERLQRPCTSSAVNPRRPLPQRISAHERTICIELIADAIWMMKLSSDRCAYCCYHEPSTLTLTFDTDRRLSVSAKV